MKEAEQHLVVVSVKPSACPAKPKAEAAPEVHRDSLFVRGSRYRALKAQAKAKVDSIAAERDRALAAARTRRVERDEALHCAETFRDELETCKLLMEAARRLEATASPYSPFRIESPTTEEDEEEEEGQQQHPRPTLDEACLSSLRERAVTCQRDIANMKPMAALPLIGEGRRAKGCPKDQQAAGGGRLAAEETKEQVMRELAVLRAENAALITELAAARREATAATTALERGQNEAPSTR